jgi:hypothetical protein
LARNPEGHAESAMVQVMDEAPEVKPEDLQAMAKALIR